MANELRLRALYIFILLCFLFHLISPFLISIVFAASMSLTLKPLHSVLMNKGLSSGKSAALLTSLFAVIISIPVFFFVIKGTVMITNKLEELQVNEKLRDQGVQALVKDMRHDFVVAIKALSSRYEFLQFLNERKIDHYLGFAVNYLLKFFQGFLTQLPALFVLLLIMILCTYTFLTHSIFISLFFQRVFGFSDLMMDRLTHIFIMDSRAVYLSNILTGAFQSLLTATGVSLLGLSEFFLVFFVTLILSFIPVIGAAPVSFVFSLWAFITGNNTAAIILVILGIFTGLVDNFLRPWLTTFGESSIPPIFAFICVIGGALWLGFPGLFIGLLLGSYVWDTIPIFWEDLESKNQSASPHGTISK
jgi:predicted PurR-regulated permease PerM